MILLFRPFLDRRSTSSSINNPELEQRLQEHERMKNELESRIR